jgi:1-acyl-sn-glycerol-3-phosphate acyltransferase
LSSFYWVFWAIFNIILRVFYRFEVIGHENIPKEGGVIIASNHISYLDPLVIGSASKRRATYMAKEGLFKIPLVGTFVRSFSFSVRRGRPQPSTIKEAVRRLEQGELIIMFPEGGRSIDGKLLNIKRGIGVIAALSKMPVVPALISGTEKALPVGARFLKPAKITVIFGKPIWIDVKEKDKHFQERISKDILETINNLKSRTEV